MSENKLPHQLVLITGTTSGIGAALADFYLKKGARVIAVNRRELGPAKQNLIAYQADVREAEQVRGLFNWLPEKAFYPDLFILNAGIHRVDNGEIFAYRDFEDVMDTNLNAVMRFVAEGLALKREGRRTFVAVSSTSNILPNPHCRGYYISKLGLTKSFEVFREKHRSDGFEFKTLILGPIRTKMLGVGPMASPLQTFVRDTISVPAEEAAGAIVRFIESNKPVFNYTFKSHAVFHLARLVKTLIPKIYTGSLPTARK